MPREPDQRGRIDPFGRLRADEAIAILAERQEGVVSRAQLRDLGISAAAIDARRKRKNLHALYHGVYAVGHRRVSRRGRLLAAVLACGDGAALSHRSAAEVWGMRRPWNGKPEVTTARECRQPRIATRLSALPPDEVTTRDGMAITTAARTLLDLGQVLKPQQLEAALNEAEVLRLADVTGLSDLLERYPRRRGTRHLRRLIAAAREGDTITKGELEALFRSFVAAHGLPSPISNGVVEGFEVDAHWPATRLIVELDSHTYHLNRHAFERDRERDRVLALAGWRVIRVTWSQLTEQGPRLARDLRALLG